MLTTPRKVCVERIVAGSFRDAQSFDAGEPYANITFAGTHRRKTPPKLKPSPMRLGRIIVRADDCYESTAMSTALSVGQSDRIAKFAVRMAGKVHTLFISCYFGEGRSAAAALAISAALGLPWRNFAEPPFAPNGHIVALLVQSFRSLGYTMSDDLPLCDKLYAAQKGLRL